MIAAIFTGSRHWTDVDVIRRDLESLPAGSVVIVGDCPTGADQHVRYIACQLGLHLEVFKADWFLDARAAGPIRNSKMVVRLRELRNLRATIAFAYLTAHPCRGTRDCMAKLKRAGFDVAERRA